MTTVPTAAPEPQTQHFVAAWCEESDIPAGRRSSSTDVTLAFAIAAATDLLYVLSGRQFRSGRSIIRPTPISSSYGQQSYLYPYSSMSGYGAAWGFAAGWSWTALGMGWWQGGQDLSEVVLQGPVRRINTILVDGSPLGPTDYTLYDGRRLIRNVDASGQQTGAWPWNQQLQLPLTEPGTWSIDYDWGKPPPDAGKAACVELSIEVARALSGDDQARLPSRVLSVATEGLTVAVGDALTFIREDLTGLPIVDLFLRVYNKGNLRRRTVFLGPNSQLGREMASYPPGS
jgi:hypothetical protein